MGSRPEVTMFIKQMTYSNTQRMEKLNEKKSIFNDAFGPFALCNRKRISAEEQFDVQMKMYNELIHYVVKVIIILGLLGKTKVITHSKNCSV